MWILAQMRAMLEAQHLERIEAKLNQLSDTAQQRGLLTHGDRSTNSAARLPN